MFRLRQPREILRCAADLAGLSQAALLERASELRWRARSGTALKKLLSEAFALGIEATRRTLGKTHFPVQVLGAIEIFRGRIVEMQTGEGKTLTAVLPAALRALAGQGCHVVTANEYLASRDAELLGPVYAKLGLTVGCVTAAMNDEARRDAYAKDVTYATAGEIGFDFLRDRLKLGAGNDHPPRRLWSDDPSRRPVQRGHYFALIDEADSVLIDDARTPLIIGIERTNRPSIEALYRWSADVAPQLVPQVDFLLEPQRRQVHLTDSGCRKLTLLAKPVLLDSLDTEQIYQHVERSLTALHAFARDKDYLVHENEIAIVDEGTGRVMEGRKWQEGLHQAIEAKERLPITAATASAARITIQSLFRRYEHLGGMTGTARPARAEFRQVYRLRVSVIPTHKPCRRQEHPTRLFASQSAKRAAIVRDVQRCTVAGRSVLIGTPSVEASEALSAALAAGGVPHVVLNARRHAEEAGVVAEAGRPGRVTIATNMAGRGTDILLEESVRAAGGLHVIATELHTSARIDRQLIGRAARQGDPGSVQFLLSLEDELLRVLAPRRREGLARRLGADEQEEIGLRGLGLLQRTQTLLERLHRRQRRQLLKHERDQLKTCRRMGLDPFLELIDG